MPLLEAIFEIAIYATLVFGSIVVIALLFACAMDVFDWTLSVVEELVEWARRLLGI